MRLLTVDFETYYDPEYSLSKLTTEQYIRSDAFEVIGVAVQMDAGEPEWFSGDHAAVKNWLQKFPWDESMAVAHNAAFDMAILSWIFGIKPRAIADTLSMARAIHGATMSHSLAKLAEYYNLGAKGTEVVNARGKRRLDFSSYDLMQYGEYCRNDTRLTYKLFQILLDAYPKTELKLIDQTLRMYTEPVLRLDAFALEKHLVEVQERKKELLAKIGGDPEAVKKHIMSNPKFADTLRAYGVIPPTKISPTTGKTTYAFAKTDDGMKELLEHPDPEVQAIVAARLGIKSTLEETRTQRFMSIAQRGNLPIPLKYYAAHTARWGGWDLINLQNLPSRGADAGALKRAILAPPGYVMIDCDSSQIEARVLAWMAGQQDLVDAFRTGRDVYKIMASAIYRKPIADITGPERFIGKSTVLGSGYGMGARKFQLFMQVANVEMTYDEAKHIIDTYRRTYPAIPALWAQGDRALAALIDGRSAPYGREGVVQVNGFLGGVVSPNGIPLRYHELRRSRKANGDATIVYTSRTGITGIWGGKFTENLTQHLARVIIGEQLLRIAKRYRVVLTVHDAIACIAPEAEAVEARAYVEECMRWTPSWADGLPLNCESGMGRSYGEC